MKLTNRPIFYITPEINWLIGIEKLIPNLHLICSQDHPLLDQMAENCQVFCLKREFPDLEMVKNSGQILALGEVQKYIANTSQSEQPAILYFKPQPKIDLICKQKDYLVLGNSTSISRPWENKIDFYKYFYDHPQINLIPAKIIKLSKFEKQDLNFPIVIQQARGWAGKTTYYIENQQQLNTLLDKLANNTVKITPFMPGQTYTLNACVHNDSTISIGQIGYQINCEQLNKESGHISTCGRSWPTNLEEKQIQNIQKQTRIVGSNLYQNKFRGYFGLDFLISQSGQIFLIEVNPRLTASTGFYSQLESSKTESSLLQKHLLTFLNPNIKFNSEIVSNQEKLQGVQITNRNASHKIKICSSGLKTGIYTLSNQQLNFVKPGYLLQHLENKNQFLLFTPSKGQKISNLSEISRIESRWPISTSKAQTIFSLVNNVVIKN